MQPITIAGAGPLALSLSQRLKAAGLAPRLVSTSAGSDFVADLTSIPEAEVACAGARTLVMLAQARTPPARLTRASLADLDRLLADTLARAARRCGVQHVVFFACGDDDPREPLLRASGVPLSVLRGGGPDPAAHLEALIHRGPGDALVTEPWTGGAPRPRARLQVCSVQRYPLPAGWSAERLATSFLGWVSGQVPAVRVASSAGTSVVSALGARALLLRHAPGRSEEASYVLEVPGGALVRRGGALARFEFRVLLDGVTAMVSLVGYPPSLPWPLYRLTQAALHEHLMKRFGGWLSAQP
jgi:hypothetical protein